MSLSLSHSRFLCLHFFFPILTLSLSVFFLLCLCSGFGRSLTEPFLHSSRSKSCVKMNQISGISGVATTKAIFYEFFQSDCDVIHLQQRHISSCNHIYTLYACWHFTAYVQTVSIRERERHTHTQRMYEPGARSTENSLCPFPDNLISWTIFRFSFAFVRPIRHSVALRTRKKRSLLFKSFFSLLCNKNGCIL